MKSMFKALFVCLALIANMHFAYAQSTSAGILPQGKTQFLDNNGKPLSGGSVNFYSPGTTTPKTTWQDSAQTIANSNPVILDSAGRGLIWGSGAYQQLVKDRLGNQIWNVVTSTAGSSSSGGGGTAIGDGNSVGTVLLWSGLIAPPNYAFAYGQELNRTTYALLLSITTSKFSATCTGGSSTLSAITDTSSIGVGNVVEATCLLAAATVLSKTANTITLSANANVNNTITATVFPSGNGNGLTTFNAPDWRGRVPVGRNNMGGVPYSGLTSTYYGADPNGLNVNGGNQSKILVAGNLPPITSTNPTQNITVSLPPNQSAATVSSTTISSVQVAVLGSGSTWVPTIGGNGWGNQNISSGSNSISVVSTNTTSTPFSLVQPSQTTNYIVKVLPDTSVSVANIGQLVPGVSNQLVGTDAGGVYSTVTLPTGLTLSGLSLAFLANTCAANSWFNAINTSGVFTCVQPNFTNLAGTIAVGQIPSNLVTNAKLATMAANTIKGNSTASSATPSDISVPACSGANQAINWVAGTGPTCVTISGGGGGGSVGPQSPQIRVTATQGTPVTTTDVATATSLFLEPYNGNQISIYDGTSSWTALTVAPSTYSLPATQTQTCTLNATVNVTGCTDTSQMTIGQQVTGTGITGTGIIAAIPTSTTLTLSSAASGSGAQSLTFKLPPNTNYDVYGINNGGLPKLIWSAAWSSDTNPPARVLQDGVEVASGATTKRLLGSARTTSLAGIIADTHLFRLVSNRYNEQPRPMYQNDPQSTWPGVVSATFNWRQANANASNQFVYIACVPRPIWAQSQGTLVSSVSASVTVGIGIDTSLSSTAQFHQQASIPSGITGNSFQTSATYTGTPGIGYHLIAWIESSFTTGTQTWIGTSSPNTQVSGIYGEIAN